MYTSPDDSNSIPYKWKNGQAILIEYTDTCFSKPLTTARFAETQEQTPVVFPLLNDDNMVTATIPERYVVRANSPNIQQAYNFLKILINPEIQTIDYYKPYNIPISNIAVDIFFARAAGTLDDQYFANLGVVNLPPVSNDFINSYKEAIKKINCVVYSFGESNQIFRQEMMPYYKGEKSYDECVKAAQAAIEIYVSE